MIIRVPVIIMPGFSDDELKAELVLIATQTSQEFDSDKVAKAMTYALGTSCSVDVLRKLTDELKELIRLLDGEGCEKARDHLRSLESYGEAFEVK